MCKVSVLTPVYNVEKYLPECMDSLLAQSLTDIEFICINDGSTDGSLAILQEYAAKDARIKIIDQPNGGYGKAMNSGLRAASGEYIGIVESDDFIDANAFAVLYDKAVQYDVEIIKTNYYVLKNGVTSFCETLEGCTYNEVFAAKDRPRVLFAPMIWNGIQRRDFLLKNDIWFNETPGASYQDTSFKFKTLACAKKVYLMEEAFLHYRMDNVNSSINSLAKVYCLCEEYAEIQRYLQAREELQDPFQYIAEVLKYRSYVWNYWRIADKYKQEFLERFLTEFVAAQEKQHLIASYWPPDNWRDLQKMLGDPQRFLYKAYEKIQRQHMCAVYFYQMAAGAAAIYLYGAGKVAGELLAILQNHDIRVDGFLVSDKGMNKSDINGIPVHQYNEIASDRAEPLILVAVKEADQYEIIKNLQKAGYLHIMAMSVELRNALRCFL